MYWVLKPSLVMLIWVEARVSMDTDFVVCSIYTSQTLQFGLTIFTQQPQGCSKPVLDSPGLDIVSAFPLDRPSFSPCISSYIVYRDREIHEISSTTNWIFSHNNKLDICLNIYLIFPWKSKIDHRVSTICVRTCPSIQWVIKGGNEK